MTTESEWEQAIEKLIIMTESRQLIWQADPKTKSRRENVEGDVYVAKVQGRNIAVYEYRFPYYDEDSSGCSSSVGAISGWEMRNEVAIEFVDESGVLQYRWPAVAGRWTLLDIIRCAVSGAQDFLKTFLAQPLQEHGVSVLS